LRLTTQLVTAEESADSWIAGDDAQTVAVGVSVADRTARSIDVTRRCIVRAPMTIPLAANLFRATSRK
jgi:hypothetical protein